MLRWKSSLKPADSGGGGGGGSAPVYDSYADGSVNNGSSIPSFNLNIGSGGNAAVIVSVRSESGGSGVTPAANITVTVGGTSAPLISGATGTGFASNHLFGVAMGSATGNQAIVVSWTSGNAYNHAVASSITGVDQTTPFNNGTGQAVAYAATSDTLAITSATGDLTFSDFGEKGGAYETVTVNNTTRYNLLGGDGRAVGSTAAGAASVNHTATIVTQSGGGAHVGCNIKAVSGGGYGLASDVLLYVPFTDADASTGADGYVKSSGGHTLTTDVFTRSGNAVINTDQTKMTGSSTAAYNPAGANSDGWELDSTISAGLEVGSSSPLSIQFWFYCSNDGSGGSARLLGWDGWYTSGSGIEFETLSTDYDRFIFYEHTGATTSRRSIGDHVLNANAWNHIYWAFQPSGSSYLGINGTVTEASGSYITNFAPTVDLNLLKTPGNADDSAKGYIQEFIVKNTVPYTANFTPSTTPLVSSGATSYKATVLADNPLFYYRLGEASGTDAYDEVATSSNGTYYNTPDLGQTGAISGDSNTSVKFKEASSEYADTVTLTSETSLLPCTIECFIKTDGASDDTGGILMIRGATPASGLNMYGSSTSVKKLGYHWNNGSATWSFSSGPTFSDDTWYYVALVIESTKATFYMIDESGTLTTPAVNTTTHAAIDVSGNDWKIGRDYGYANRSFQGYIDEVAIYDQALSQSTVVAHAAAAGYTAGGGITLETSAYKLNQTGYNAPRNLTFTTPAVQANDILLLIVSSESECQVGTANAGWNLIVNKQGSSAHLGAVFAYWKRATGAASETDETFGDSTTEFFNSRESTYSWCGAYSGCATSGSPVSAYGEADIGYTTEYDVNVTPTVANTMVVAAMTNGANSGYTFSWDDGTTLVTGQHYYGSGFVSINEKLETSSGSAVTRSGSLSGNSGGPMIAVALKPA